MCSPFPTCQLGQASQDALTSLLQSAVDSLINSVTPALTSLGTLWVKMPTPDLTGSGSTEARGAAPDTDGILAVLGYVSWIGFAIAIIAVMILGAMIATRMRTGDGLAAVGRIGVVLGAVILMSSASSVVALILPSGPQGVSGATGYLQASLWWYMAAAAMLSVIIGGMRMVWEQHARPGLDTVKSLLTLIVVAGAGVGIVSILIRAADSFSSWIIDGALSCSISEPHCFPGSVAKLLQLNNHLEPGSGSVSSVLVMALIAALALLSTLVQIVLLIARSGMLVILTGVLPIAASATNTDNGKNWFRKCVAWLIGFLLYKPAAAIVYAAAFKLFATDIGGGDDLISMLTGVMLMVLAVFALPAILRFVSPMAAGAAGGGASGAAAVAALAALPSGARAGGSRSTGGFPLSAAPSGSGAGSAGGSQHSIAESASATGSPTTTGPSTTTGSTGSSGSTASAGSAGSSRPAGHSGSVAHSGSVGASGSTGAGSSESTGSTGGAQQSVVPQGRRYAAPAGSGSGSGNAGRAVLAAAQLAGGAAHSITNDTTGDGQG